MERSTGLRLVSGIVRAVLIAAIGVTLFVAYGLIDNAWYKVLAVQGGSMEPTISAGDLIVVTRPPAQVEVGQVLTLQVDGAVVTHRVVEVKPDGSFVTQGDANETRDDFSANDVHIVGEYRFALPFIGRLIEPIITGAWATDADPIAASAVSGEWAESAIARAIDVGGRITWEPAPSASPGPTASASLESAPTASAESTPSTEPPASATPVVRPVPSREVEPVPEPSATESPSPSDSASPSESPSPSPWPTPTPTPTPMPSLEPSAAP